MAKFYVYSARASKGARALAKALVGKRIRSPVFAPHSSDTIINWGDSNCPTFTSHDSPRLLNSSSTIRLAANKLTAFDALSSAGVSIPAFAKTKEAVHWEGTTVVRHKLTGHSGEGIEICTCPKSELPDAPLYVQYIKKDQEYRVHVGRSLTQTLQSNEAGGSDEGTSISVIAVQRKARRHDTPDSAVNWQVRNHSNGFVFVRGGFTPPQAVVDAAKQALVASGLDFGAVDVIQTKGGKVYVLEINTAPGLEGTTVTDYANFFRGNS